MKWQPSRNMADTVILSVPDIAVLCR